MGMHTAGYEVRLDAKHVAGARGVQCERGVSLLPFYLAIVYLADVARMQYSGRGWNTTHSLAHT